MRTYTIVVMRAEQIVFKEDIPFHSPENFSQSVGEALEGYAVRSGVDLEGDDVTVSVLAKRDQLS